MQKSRHYKKNIHGFSLDEIFVAKTYDSSMQQKLHRFKFVHNYSDTTYFTSLFHTIIQESNIKNFSETIIIYPSISLKDRIFRGPNHAKRLAIIFARITGAKYPICPFIKKFFSGHQSHRNKRERKRVQLEYFLKKNQQKIVENKDIIFIDDIITTGYTVHTLGRLLKHAGAKKITGYFLSSKKV